MPFNRARVAENECFLVSSNAAGAQSGVLFMGHSKIVGPWGTVVAVSDYREAIVTADVDPDAVRLARPGIVSGPGGQSDQITKIAKAAK